MNNKVAIVTGSSSGIGAASALALARAKFDVVITYKENAKGAEETAKKIAELGQKTLVFQVDLNLEEAGEKLIDATMEAMGRIDVLVNNAGGYIKGDEWDGDYNSWMDTMKQNVVSVLNVSKNVIKVFEKQKFGTIINIASRYSISGNPEAPAYSAAKSAIVNITQSYAKLLAPFGRANSISPSAVKSGYWLSAPKDELEQQFKLSAFGRLVEPEEVANLVVFLASEDSSMISGQNILVGQLL
jgi:NAD(P)-dependent dehydrogenase (short-subunit alcohol dehydrogenase family)